MEVFSELKLKFKNTYEKLLSCKVDDKNIDHLLPKISALMKDIDFLDFYIGDFLITTKQTATRKTSDNTSTKTTH